MQGTDSARVWCALGKTGARPAKLGRFGLSRASNGRASAQTTSTRMTNTLLRSQARFERQESDCSLAWLGELSLRFGFKRVWPVSGAPIPLPPPQPQWANLDADLGMRSPYEYI